MPVTSIQLRLAKSVSQKRCDSLEMIILLDSIICVSMSAGLWDPLGVKCTTETKAAALLTEQLGRGTNTAGHSPNCYHQSQRAHIHWQTQLAEAQHSVRIVTMETTDSFRLMQKQFGNRFTCWSFQCVIVNIKSPATETLILRKEVATVLWYWLRSVQMKPRVQLCSCFEWNCPQNVGLLQGGRR